jgi:ATP-binding cassette subfamily F protein uup
MPLVTISDLTIGFRGPALLDGVNCLIEPEQRIGLLGRNGAGKTTFMRLLQGALTPDHGQIAMAPGARVALLPQDVPRDLTGTIHEVVSHGLDAVPEFAEAPWRAEQQVDQILSRMGLSPTAPVQSLSSGMIRRVLLARVLVSDPQLLLLDEPTNHLDIDSIRWLEEFLLKWRGAFLFVTHDRMFLRNLATRILEIDRGQLFDWSCDYDTFLRRKEAAIAAQEKQDALFDKKLAEEERWIRQGIKARRTRNEGRVRALEDMRRERVARRDAPGKVRLQIQEAARSGNLVADVEDISFKYDGEYLFKDFSTNILRGDKVGILGPNGAGKTTLLKTLLGQLAPMSGRIRLGSNLKIAYFDQLRAQLNENQTVAENVGDGYESIEINGNKQHILGYLQNFLFTPERARTEIRFLSGGERNRILLAKLFAKPANVIVLDEPTNDLDAETLDLLEERLMEFSGTVLIVSHDREFINHVVTSTIVFENGNIREYVGGYDDWLRQRPVESPKPVAKKEAPPRAVASGSSTTTASPSRKLSYNEKRELELLPAKIEQLDASIAELHDRMASADFYQQPGDIIAREQNRLANLEADLATSYARWEELEAFG